MTEHQALVALCFLTFGEPAAREMATRYGVIFEEVDLSQEALDAFCEDDPDEYHESFLG